jgi:hypothetical protein
MSARLAQILDLFAEDSQLNVYAGELEVRPPSAPTTTATVLRRSTIWRVWLPPSGEV